MPQLFGAHMSIAGGLHLAAERARAAGCDVLQVFTKNNNQWQCKPIAAGDCAAFGQALKTHHIAAPIAHTSYLINLGTPDDFLWHKSVEALVVEWQRCEQLRLEGLVMHPGAHTTSTPQQGLERIAGGVALAIERVQPKSCRLLLENTAGQGSCLGWQIEQLGWLLNQLDRRHVGICWDTCHALAAGYDFPTARGMKAMLLELEQHGVLSAIAAIHVNDSKKACGSRVDRHEHIGQGYIGEAGFGRFLRVRALAHVPRYLETPKGIEAGSGEEWDVLNLRILRRLASSKRLPRK